MNNKDVFSHSFGGWKSNPEVPVGLVASETPVVSRASLLLLFHMIILLCIPALLWLSVLGSEENQSDWLRAYPAAHLNLITPLKSLSLKKVTFSCAVGLGLAHRDLGEHISPLTYTRHSKRSFY